MSKVLHKSGSESLHKEEEEDDDDDDDDGRTESTLIGRKELVSKVAARK
jgi:hypothetical protein